VCQPDHIRADIIAPPIREQKIYLASTEASLPGRRSSSIQASLIAKSREAALNAVQTFNNPLMSFRTETFIVLMVIAWTYLLHAYYRAHGIEYRYFEKLRNRRRFHRTRAGAFKYWELDRCLDDDECPLDPPTKTNLRFLIGLRHEIEHHQSVGVDEQFAGRYLACCLNYERAITQLFGERFGLGNQLTFTLHFRDLTVVPLASEVSKPMPNNVAKYVQVFDAAVPEEEFQSPHFSYRLIFVRKLTNNRGQADRAIEFLEPSSVLAQTIDKDRWVLREVERPKYLAKDVLAKMRSDGFPRFNSYHHTCLWKAIEGKNPGKGFGTEVGGTWYWYERWIEHVHRHCVEEGDLYRA
jgi:hypothetical protein